MITILVFFVAMLALISFAIFISIAHTTHYTKFIDICAWVFMGSFGLLVILLTVLVSVHMLSGISQQYAHNTHMNLTKRLEESPNPITDEDLIEEVILFNRHIKTHNKFHDNFWIGCFYNGYYDCQINLAEYCQ